MAPRLPLVRGAPARLLLLLAVVLAQLGPLSCDTLRGSVTCLDCAAGHHLSGVVVAVKCTGGAGLHAAQTDGSGSFDVAVPAASGSRCAARVLGGAEQLCAPQGLAVARVVAAAGGSYALGSRLAVFTRCGAGAGAVATMATGSGGQRPAPPGPRPVMSPPQAVGRGSSSPPYGLGIPLIYFFPFIPIIGIP
ncbi:uncharacterized protein LOC104584272 [Brachypodium distachyon]|uniref:Uncharacterized protein n=1 Tax=Brachypodium distachyon TaxID=15368 RepID=I1IA92_BRADI|nr:uncharacterized protein LOC104584272 [Brachypodium distachyon]KQJ99746.1 hypothetical protein BRADI_3g45020v3 [Brachypodium distachyon]|eukprot:XP_010236804.1 uncharacterized protein LOC104584272 [Brachypodium distachyon]